MVHNYGDVRAIYGNLSTIANDPIEARNTPGNTMIGVGMTPEGIETNPVMYDLMVRTKLILYTVEPLYYGHLWSKGQWL